MSDLTPAEQLTMRRLQVVISAGYLPNPGDAHIRDLRDVVALVERLTAGHWRTKPDQQIGEG